MKSLNLILDGNNMIFRAYYVTKDKQIVNEVNISAVTQFLKMAKGYVESFKPDDIYIVWDKRLNPEGKNFRKELVDYKGHRNVEGDTLNEIFNAVDVIERITASLGIKNMYPWALEADDIASFLCKELDGNKVVISSDKDLLQLVSDDVTVFNTTKNIEVTLDNFEEFTQVPKEAFIDYKAILGDKSDNIDGLDRYGEVKSKRLAISQDWKSLTKDQMDILSRNRIIMNLEESYKISEGEYESYQEQLKSLDSTFDERNLRKLGEEYSLTTFLRDIPSWRTNLNNKVLLEEWILTI